MSLNVAGLDIYDCGGISTEIGDVNSAQNSRFITLTKALDEVTKKAYLCRYAFLKKLIIKISVMQKYIPIVVQYRCHLIFLKHHPSCHLDHYDACHCGIFQVVI